MIKLRDTRRPFRPIHLRVNVTGEDKLKQRGALTHPIPTKTLTLIVRFTDVYSTEDWALAMVPQPVLGVVMLFPIKESSEKHKEEEAERLHGMEKSDSVMEPYFM